MNSGCGGMTISLPINGKKPSLCTLINFFIGGIIMDISIIITIVLSLVLVPSLGIAMYWFCYWFI
jgi:hypothetical protein